MYYPHDFHRMNGELVCEQVRLVRIAGAVGTPVYVYSAKTMVEHVRKLKAAFASVRPLICFSVKANGTLAILTLLVKEGAGLDIVSGGELYKALRAGCPPERIVFAGAGKQREEIREALAHRIGFFNVESEPELEAIDAEARRARRRARVALRLNPDVEAHTHRYITTGVAQTKFGMDARAILRLFARRRAFPRVDIVGLHMHIGSQITRSGPFVEAVRRAGDVIRQGRRLGASVDWLNLGGGLGIIYKDERPQRPSEFAGAVLPLVKPLGVRLILGPGRFIVGNAGCLLTRVIHVKRGGGKRFAIVDAGMNDLIRPALYGAYHEVVPILVPRRTTDDGRRMTAVYDVVGPICESADVFAHDRRLGSLRSGELLAVLGTGAYGSTMASNYNGRLRAAEVLVKGARWAVIRRRETRSDLIRHDVIPERLL
jgi:diaminopimelate decarboxylase